MIELGTECAIPCSVSLLAIASRTTTCVNSLTLTVSELLLPAFELIGITFYCCKKEI